MKNVKELKLEEIGIKKGTLKYLSGLNPVSVAALTGIKELKRIKGIGEAKEKEITEALASSNYVKVQSDQSICLHKLLDVILQKQRTADNHLKEYSTAEIKDFIDKTLSCLTGKEKAVIIGKFGLLSGDLLSLEEYAKAHLCTKERIRQIQAKAFRKLHRPEHYNCIEEWHNQHNS